jgi:hypothetical protein
MAVDDDRSPGRTMHGVGTPEQLKARQDAEQAQPELARALVMPSTTAQPETYSGHFLGISLKRAFRLDIHVDEVLVTERAHLEAVGTAVREPAHQAFLAWRRSVLLMVAVMFVPLTIMRFIETFDGPPMHFVGRGFEMLPAVAEGAFCVVAFDQLKNWANWRRQRRVLFVAWLIYFLAPFIVYLYPWRTAFDESVRAGLEFAKQAFPNVNLRAVTLNQMHLAIGLAAGVKAMLALGPKVISLMPGLIRASIVTKLQFPGTTAPGWLMMLAAPFYALFAYIIVILPYQMTGSWHFLVGNGGLLVAQIFIAISGHRLTVPLTNEESYARVHKTWLVYIGMIVVSAGFMFYGLYDFIHQMNYGLVRVATSILAIASNVLLDTLIGTDAIIAAMAFFRRGGGGGPPDPKREQLMQEAWTKLDTFAK